MEGRQAPFTSSYTDERGWPGRTGLWQESCSAGKKNLQNVLTPLKSYAQPNDTLHMIIIADSTPFLPTSLMICRRPDLFPLMLTVHSAPPRGHGDDAGTVCLLLKISTVPLLLKVILILDKQNKDKQGSYPRALMWHKRIPGPFQANETDKTSWFDFAALIRCLGRIAGLFSLTNWSAASKVNPSTAMRRAITTATERLHPKAQKT